MTDTATPADPRAPDFSTLAPVFAARFTRIIAGLLAVIARGFLRNPALVVLTVPLHRRLTRNVRHLTALMARLAAGEASGSGAGPTANRPRAQAPRDRSPIPTTKGWIIRELKHEAAVYRHRLADLLAEPGISDLLEAAPTACRLLNPICHMLGLPRHAAKRSGDESGRCAPSRTESAVAESAPDISTATPFPAPKPVPRPPPCEHLARRWPWLPHPAEKPA